MRHILQALGAALAIWGASAPAQAAIIGFDDIPIGFVPASYQGFTWSGGQGSGSWVVRSEANNIFPGVETVSGPNFAWSNGGTDLSLSDGLFDFNSAWIRGGHSAGGPVTVKGFVGATELFSQTFSVTTTYQLFTFNYLGIDRVTIGNNISANLLFDDIVVNAQAAVPEPSTLTMFSLGGLGLAFGALRRRFRKAA